MFKYCSFYGLSAPLLLLLSKETIDGLFEFPLTHNAGRRLQNLQWELEKLKDILSDPHIVHTQVDETSPKIQQFLQGVNAAILEKRRLESASTLPEVSGDTLDLDLDVDKDETTSLFNQDLSLDLSLDDTSKNAELPGTDASGLLDLDGSGTDLALDTGAAADAFSLDLDMDSAVSAEPVLEVSEDIAMDDEAASIVEVPLWSLPADLVVYGGHHMPSAEDPFPTFGKYMYWYSMNARKELSEEDYESLTYQQSKLPRRLSGRLTIDKRTHKLQDEYPELYSILNTIVTKAFTSVNGVTMIDYALQKVTDAAGKSSAASATFLGIKHDLLKNLGNIYAYNSRINEALVVGPLSTQSIEAKRRILEGLIEDCKILLGIDAVNSGEYNLEAYASGSYQSDSELLDRLFQTSIITEARISEYREEAADILAMLRNSPERSIRECLHNASEFIFLVRVRAVLADLEKNILTKFGLGGFDLKPEDINDLGIQLAKLFKIGGVYVGYSNQFRETFRLTTKFVGVQNYVVPSATDENYYDSLYTEIELVYVYLLSLKGRLTGAN